MWEELLTPPPRDLPRKCYAQLRRAVIPLFAAGAVLVIIAIAVETAFTLQHFEARRLAERGTPVEGILVDRLSGRYLMRLTVAYTGRDRRFRSVRQWVRVTPADRWLLLGNRVRIFYDPANPDRACVEQLARPGASLASSLPVLSLAVMALLVGGVLLAVAGSLTRSARRLLLEGTLVSAHVTCAASWKNLWLTQFDVTQDNRTRLYRGFVPPGWRPASRPGEPGSPQRSSPMALVGPAPREQALLLIEPSLEES